MKLPEYNKIGNEYTAKASDIVRQLALAGIAVVWLFGSHGSSHLALEGNLILPLTTLALTLLFELLQYVVGGETWKVFFRKMEKMARENGDADSEIKAPRKYNLPIYFFYWGKLVLVLFSYMLIINYLVIRL